MLLPDEGIGGDGVEIIEISASERPEAEELAVESGLEVERHFPAPGQVYHDGGHWRESFNEGNKQPVRTLGTASYVLIRSIGIARNIGGGGRCASCARG